MKIKELIELLSMYDGDTRVKVFDEANGHIDITETIEVKINNDHYVSIV